MRMRHSVQQKNEKAILKRTERAMERVKCGWKVKDKKTVEGKVDILGLKESVD